MTVHKNQLFFAITNSIFAGLFALLSWVIAPMSPVSGGDENSEPPLPVTAELDENSGNSDAWAYYLIDPEHPLPWDYVPTVAVLQNSVPVDKRIADSARSMIAAASSDGVTLIPVSGYRSFAKQRENYNAYVDKYIAEGLAEAAARAFADTQIAQPGESEHNAGLAIDFATPDWYINHEELDETFAETDAFVWLNDKAYKFGFILSYHKGKEQVQGGIAYEPWHWRYVGDNAEDVWLTGVTLPEYIGFYG
jgi:D-alanyl-D-alanine carboxypeptidase